MMKCRHNGVVVRGRCVSCDHKLIWEMRELLADVVHSTPVTREGRCAVCKRGRGTGCAHDMAREFIKRS